ncbi:MAG: hypothetical protein R3A10_09960 [Caldilineaceae bacterium]
MARAVARFPKIILFTTSRSPISTSTPSFQLKRALKELIRGWIRPSSTSPHDQTEAMTLADRIALMKDGSIVQYDEQRTLYNQPNDVFGGWFLGNPGMNFVEHSFDNAGSSALRPAGDHSGAGASAREGITLGIRPEHVQVSNELLPGGVRGSVVDRVIVIGGQYFGSHWTWPKRLKAKVAAHVEAGLQDRSGWPCRRKRITCGFDKDGPTPRCNSREQSEGGLRAERDKTQPQMTPLQKGW